MRIKARSISGGGGRGEAMILKEPFGFYGNVDPKTGIIIERGNPLEGRSIKDKIFIFPYGEGSTVGSYVIYALKKSGAAPAAIVNEETESIIATGAILAEIPCVDRPEKDIFEIVHDGDILEVDGDEGMISWVGDT
jgi:hypothetical protein